jgi:alkanesulfonate monooxygenase SsuD/methylene tetrahydromethanopterin reductase-like flavin-dependent oxidoreductase (luciferase family)
MASFGLYLSLQHPADRDPRELVAERLELVRVVRDAGFDSVFAGQHFLVPPGFQMLQPVPMLARVASEAGSMTLGTAVLIATLLNPLEIAESAATLAALVPGGFVLGLGAGYRPEEDAAFGVEQRRTRTFADKLRVVRDLLEGKAVTASGPGYRLEEARLTLLPQPRPQIWVAATTDGGVRRAAEIGDAWLAAPSSRLRDLEHHVGLLRELSDGRPVQVAAMREAVVSDSDEEALALAAPFLDPQGTSSAGRVEHEPGRYVVGGPETAARELQALLDTGVDHVVFRVQRPGIALRAALRTLELLARDVIPILRSPLRSEPVT